MAATDAPTKSPVLRPTPAPIDPTSVPIAPVPVPTPEPVDPTPAPVPEPEPIDPTPAPIDPTSVPASCQSIAEVVCTTPEIDTLCSLVNTAGIYDVLISDTMTFFGPTNTAFEKLPEKLLDAALYDTDLLTFILFGHVVSNQAMLTRDFVSENGPIDSLSMANDEKTTIQCTTFMDSEGNSGSNTFVVGGGNSDALTVPPMIIGPNGMACNGIIHALDGVILPEPEKPPTDAPVVDPTPAPVGPVPNPTAAPITPTTEPVIPTGAPIVQTTSPIEPTVVPVDPTAVPIDPTAVPIDPTAVGSIGTAVGSIGTAVGSIGTAVGSTGTAVGSIGDVVCTIGAPVGITGSVVGVIGAAVGLGTGPTGAGVGSTTGASVGGSSGSGRITPSSAWIIPLHAIPFGPIIIGGTVSASEFPPPTTKVLLPEFPSLSMKVVH